MGPEEQQKKKRQDYKSSLFGILSVFLNGPSGPRAGQLAPAGAVHASNRHAVSALNES